MKKIIQEALKKEWVSSLLLFISSSLFTMLLIDKNEITSLSFLVFLVTMLFISVAYFLTLKFSGTLDIWKICITLRGTSYYKSMAAISSFFIAITLLFDGKILEEDLLNHIANIFKSESLKISLELKLYLVIPLSMLVSSSIFKLFAPISSKLNRSDFKDAFLDINTKTEVNKTLNYLDKHKDYLLEKDKENLYQDINKLKNYKKKSPNEIYDVLKRREKYKNPIASNTCAILSSSPYFYLYIKLLTMVL